MRATVKEENMAGIENELRYMYHKEAATILRRGDANDVRDHPPTREDHAQTKPNGQVDSLRHEKKQESMEPIQHVDSKLKQGQSENKSGTMAYSDTHFDKRIPSRAGQLWREHFTYYLSTSTPFNSKPRQEAQTNAGNPQTGESPCTIQTSRRCHPLCFALSSSHHAYSALLGEESRPLSKGKQSEPLSSIITERHPLGLGDDFFSDDSDSDDEDANGQIGM